MAAKGQSYAEKFSRWEVLITNGKPALPDMPHVTEDMSALEQKLTQVRTLESRLEDLRSQAKEIGTQIRTAAAEGEKIRTRLGANLRGKFGFESEALVKFGFKPRPIVRRSKAKKPPEQTPGTPAPNGQS